MTSVTDTPTRPRHIHSLSAHEKRTFLNSFRLVFADIDGVVWNAYTRIEGAPGGFNALKNAGKNITFITNNSVRPVSNCIEKFRALNLNIDQNDIWHPAKTTVLYLQSIQFEGLIYIIATEPYKQVLRDAGFKLIDGPNKILEESLTDLAQNAFDKEPVRAVVVDLDFNLSAVKMIRAHNYLKHPDCLLLVGATDMLLPVKKDFNILGPGPFAKVLAESSKKEMITLGKPGLHLCELLKRSYNIDNAHKVLMIGDMLEQDIAFGRLCGFQTLVVLSGGCNLKDLMAETNSQRIPDYYADSMADFVQFFEDLNKAKV